MRIFFLGYPGGMGGANTECLHTAKLWRGAGWDVDFIPTWGKPQPGKSTARDSLDRLGCKTHFAERKAESLAEIPGLPGSTVVCMCNEHLAESIVPLRNLGCKLVWVNCMTFVFPWEGIAFGEAGPPDACIYQSEFQREKLEPLHVRMGHDPSRSFVIRGAFDLESLKFKPNEPRPGKPFVVGRLARPDTDKWAREHWRVLEAVPYRQRQGLVMGWNTKTEAHCGPSPAWAEVLKPQQIPIEKFLRRCHAMIGLNGGARENWPRVGLEAMAAGVPMVVQDAWGWREMVRHGETGFLASCHQEFAYYLAKLGYEPETHRRIAEAARVAVAEFADPVRLASEWFQVFRSVRTNTIAGPAPSQSVGLLGRPPTHRPTELRPSEIERGCPPESPAVSSLPPNESYQNSAFRPPKIACQCVTFNRPDQLRDAIRSFEVQTYPHRELVILDDAGQYGNQAGPGWRIVSIDRRFRTLGEKRNACVALCDADYIAVWDDDDIYLPWHLEELARAFSLGARFVRPARILTLTGLEPQPRLKETKGLFHGAWGFTREAYTAAGGYPFIQSGQDQGLMRRMKDVGVETFAETERLSYIYRWCSHGGPPHLSAMGPGGYERRGQEQIVPVPNIRPEWSRDWVQAAGLEDYHHATAREESADTECACAAAAV